MVKPASGWWNKNTWAIWNNSALWHIAHRSAVSEQRCNFHCPYRRTEGRMANIALSIFHRLLWCISGARVRCYGRFSPPIFFDVFFVKKPLACWSWHHPIAAAGPRTHMHLLQGCQPLCFWDLWLFPARKNLHPCMKLLRGTEFLEELGDDNELCFALKNRTFGNVLHTFEHRIGEPAFFAGHTIVRCEHKTSVDKRSSDLREGVDKCRWRITFLCLGNRGPWVEDIDEIKAKCQNVWRKYRVEEAKWITHASDTQMLQEQSTQGAQNLSISRAV